MKLRIKVYSREPGMGISTAQSVVVETSLKPAELGGILSTLTPYGVQIHRDLRTKTKPIRLEDALLWVRDLLFTREVMTPTTISQLELVGTLPPLISSVESSSRYPLTFFHSKYLTLEGAQKVLGELGIQNVRLAKSGAFYVSGEYVNYGATLYTKVYTTIIEKDTKVCER